MSNQVVAGTEMMRTNRPSVKVEVWRGRRPSESLRILPLGARRELTTREKLQQAAVALEAGRKQEARLLLEDVIQENPTSERGWLWLADAVDSVEERRFCLNQVLVINNRNALARRALEAMDTGPASSPLLRIATLALKTGHRDKARRLLERVVEANPESERGWYWLSEVVDFDEERRFCLEQALSINRRNALARRELEVMGPGSTWSPLERPAALVSDRTETGSRSIVKAVLIAVGYWFGLTVAELLTAVVEPRVGLVLHGALLMILLTHAALTWGSPGYRLLLSLAFAPLIRLLSLSMPLAGFPRIYWYFIVSVPLIIAALVAWRVMGFSRKEIGLNLNGLPIQVLVALTGMSLGYIEYRILSPDPLAQNLVWENLLLPALIMMFCTGFLEELIFRGMMQHAITRVLGVGWGVIYVSALFATLHIGYQSLPDVVFVFGVALFFGLVKAHTGSILGVTLAHGFTNILLFLTLPHGVNHFDIIAHYLNWP